MSYVQLGALPLRTVSTSKSAPASTFVKPVVEVKPLNRLDPLFNFSKANRDFTSKLIVKWLDENRGIPGVEIPGLGVGEKGVKQGGVAQTVVKGKRISLKTAYNTLKASSNRNKAQYDTMRASTLAIILERDSVHVLNCAAQILIDGKTRFDWNALLGAAGLAISNMGTDLVGSFSAFTAPFSPDNFGKLVKETGSLAKMFEGFPTMPLGAYNAQGVTISYYEDPRLLSFSDSNMKSFYEQLRDADLGWQKAMNDLNNFLSPFYGLMTACTGGLVNFGALANASKLPLPTAPLAAILEITAGNKPIDRSFYDLMALMRQQMAAAAGIFGFVGTSCGAIAGILTASAVGLPVAAVLAPIAAVGGVAATAAGITAATLGSVKPGQVPTKQQFKDMVHISSAVLFRPAPSDAEIDKMYAKLLEVESGAPAPAPAPAPSPGVSKTPGRGLDVRVPTRTGQPIAPASKSEFPLLPVLAVAGIGYLLVSRGKK